MTPHLARTDLARSRSPQYLGASVSTQGSTVKHGLGARGGPRFALRHSERPTVTDLGLPFHSAWQEQWPKTLPNQGGRTHAVDDQLWAVRAFLGPLLRESPSWGS